MKSIISVTVDDMNVEETKTAIESTKSVRGETSAAIVKRENQMLMFRCRPSLGVLSETEMIRDVIDCTVSRLDYPTLSVELPNVFE